MKQEKENGMKINSLYEYINIPQIQEKKIIIFDCLRQSRDFAIKLLLDGIRFDYFLYAGNADDYKLPKCMNRDILSISQVADMEDTVIIAEYEKFDEAYDFLGKYGLADKLVEIETVTYKLQKYSAIIIYGTGSRAKKTYEELNGKLQVTCFADSDYEKKGALFLGKEIITAEQIKEQGENVAVVIGSTFYKEIYEKLISMGFCSDDIFYQDKQKYALPVRDLDGQEYHMNQLLIGDILRKVNNRTVTLYGADELINKLKYLFAQLEVNIVSTVEMSKEFHEIYEIAYKMGGVGDIIIILDTYSKEVHKKFKELGMDEERLLWMYGYCEYDALGLNKKNATVLDPTLGYGFVGKEDEFPGFEKYCYADNRRKPFVILVLGGSTTSGKNVHYKCWSKCLSELLTYKQIPHIIYNGGCQGFTVSQELLKLIRDGFSLKPDIVINYSGINQVHGAFSSPETPFIDMYTARCYEAMSKGVKLKISTGDTVSGVNYGVSSELGAFDYWLEQCSMMHALCELRGIWHMTFNQPALVSYSGQDEAVLSYLLYSGCLYNTKRKQCDLVDNEKYSERCIGVKYERFLDFRKCKRENIPWLCDLSDLFDNDGDVYIDDCHVNEKGNQIIASKIFDKIKGELQSKLY